jgi:hypothetical protein
VYFYFATENGDYSDVIVKFHTTRLGGQIKGIDPSDDIALFMTGLNPQYIEGNSQMEPYLKRLKPLELHSGDAEIGQEAYISGFPIGAAEPFSLLGNIVRKEMDRFPQPSIPEQWRRRSPVPVYKVDVEGNQANNGAPLLGGSSSNTVLGMVAETSNGSNFTTIIPSKMVMEGLDKLKVPYDSDAVAVWTKMIVEAAVTIFILGLSIYVLVRQSRPKKVPTESSL